MAFERHTYRDPDVLHYRHPGGATPILEIRPSTRGGVEILFYRGADPLGPYHAPSERKAMQWIKRWMRARGREDRLQGPEAYRGMS